MISLVRPAMYSAGFVDHAQDRRCRPSRSHRLPLPWLPGSRKVAAGDAGAANQDMSHRVVRQRGARIVRDEQFSVRHHMADAHEFKRIARFCGIEFDLRADIQAVPIHANPTVVRP